MGDNIIVTVEPLIVDGAVLPVTVKINQATIQVLATGVRTTRRIDRMLGGRAVTWQQFRISHEADEMPVGESYWETLPVEDPVLDILSCVFDLVGTVLTRWGTYEMAA